MTVVSRVQMVCESRTSPSDALTSGIKAVFSSIDNMRDKRILVDNLQVDSDDSGLYCVSMRISIEAGI